MTGCDVFSITSTQPTDTTTTTTVPVTTTTQTQYTIHFETNGGTSITSITQEYDTVIIPPSDPTRDGYVFGGWYSDENLTITFAFDTMLVENLTLYAKWTPLIIEDDPNDYSFLLKSDGTYEVMRYVGTNTELVIPSLFLGKAVTSISSDAFYNNSNIVTIEIHANISSICEGAFYGLLNLSAITVAETNLYYFTEMGVLFDKQMLNLYYYPAGKTDIAYQIPSSVNQISNYAFEFCGKLESITVPASVVTIGYSAFAFTKSLTSITVAEDNAMFSSLNGVLFDKQKLTLLKYPEGKAETNYQIPSSVTSIGIVAFENCIGLTSMLIPSSVTSIGRIAFYDCSNLASIFIPSSVTIMGYEVFRDCSNLSIYVEAASRPSGWDSWNPSSRPVFWNSRTITYESNDGSVIPVLFQMVGSSLTAPIAPTRDGYTFDGWYINLNLTSLFVFSVMQSENLTLYAKWEEIIFEDDPIEYSFYLKQNDTYEVTGYIGTKTELVIPSTYLGIPVTSIGDWAFGYRSSLTSVIIPSNITVIGNQAFYQCSSLSNIDISTSVFSIGTYAFFQCISLTNIVLPTDLLYIGFLAFSECTGLSSITVPSGVISINYYAFENCVNLETIVIPLSVSFMGDSIFGGCSNLTIYAEASSQPIGWVTTWNSFYRPVYWSYSETKTVTFETSGGNVIESITQVFGSTVTQPVNPIKEGYNFDGWYLDEELTVLYSFSNALTENITLYAKWID